MGSISSISSKANNLLYSPIAFWHLEESSGNRVDATNGGYTLSEGAGSVPNAIGKIGNAANFNGTNTKFLTNSSISVGSTFSIACWVKLNSYSPSNEKAIWGCGTIYNHNMTFYITNSNNTFTFYNGGVGDIITSFVPALNTWYHTVVTVTPNGQKLYIDGNLIGSFVYDHSFDNSWTNFSLSNFYIAGTAGYPIDATIDEVGIWDLVLTSDQILNLYNTNKNSISISTNFIKILSANIDSAIAGFASNDNATKKIFSTMTPNGNCCAGDSSTDPINPVFTRSTTCWAKNIDTSPISPWNNGGGYSVPESAGGGGGTGTLISPRHILLANHFYIKSGKKLIFVDMSNNCYIRTLSNSLQVGTTDIRIGLLDSDLPSNVSFCKVASLDLAQKITATNNIPLIYTDQNRAAFVANTNNDPSSFQYIVQSSDSQRTKFWYTLVGGDSGNPACFVYNNKLILLLHFIEANGGYCAPFYINEINSVMNTLGGGYNLSIFNKQDITSGKITLKKS
jgi:hypothetical protein